MQHTGNCTRNIWRKSMLCITESRIRWQHEKRVCLISLDRKVSEQHSSAFPYIYIYSNDAKILHKCFNFVKQCLSRIIFPWDQHLWYVSQVACYAYRLLVWIYWRFTNIFGSWKGNWYSVSEKLTILDSASKPWKKFAGKNIVSPLKIQSSHYRGIKKVASRIFAIDLKHVCSKHNAILCHCPIQHCGITL
jgi:hypothetical protein